MDRILIVGVDSLVGRSIADQLSSASDVVGFWLKNPAVPNEWSAARMDEKLFTEKCQDADAVIFCGGAAVSSWDADFGTFGAEEKWLKSCVTVTRNCSAKFVYVSSDAVFGGPWLFHDDDSASYAESKAAGQIRKHEKVVCELTDALIVRTNVVGIDNDASGFAGRVMDRIKAGECEHVEAAVHSTPISSTEFSTILTECLTTGMTGYTNIGGAERTSPFLFATLLAAGIGGERDHFVPANAEAGANEERALRCSRIRQELKIASPMLTETVDQIVSQLPTVQRQTAAA